MISHHAAGVGTAQSQSIIAIHILLFANNDNCIFIYFIIATPIRICKSSPCTWLSRKHKSISIQQGKWP